MITDQALAETLELLNIHHEAFWRAAPLASKTGHPVPSDSRGWSQIIVSALTGIPGMKRQKGQDLADGSDVKAANTWESIDTPRFNGVLKAGTKAEHAGKLTFLDSVPFIFFAFWDHDSNQACRFRLWVVRTQVDPLFRQMAEAWYKAAENGIALKASGQKLRKGEDIGSNNFQLHPPRGKDTNEIRNMLGTFEYPLLFAAVEEGGNYKKIHMDISALFSGLCK
jgi:hypothetical protein